MPYAKNSKRTTNLCTLWNLYGGWGGDRVKEVNLSDLEWIIREEW